MTTALDASILQLRDEKLSQRVIAERLGVRESRVQSCIRRHGRVYEFRAKQGHRAASGKPYQPVVYAAKVERLIEKYGVLMVEAACGGGYIASFGDVPGTACETVGEAINDAAEACSVEYGE